MCRHILLITHNAKTQRLRSNPLKRVVKMPLLYLSKTKTTNRIDATSHCQYLII